MSAMNDNSALMIVPKAISHIYRLLNDAREVNEILDSSSVPVDRNTSLVNSLIHAVGSFINYPVDERFAGGMVSTPTVARYLRWIDDCHSVLEAILRSYSSTFSEITSSVGKNPPALGETIETVVSNYSNSGLGTEFIRRVNDQTGITAINRHNPLRSRVFAAHEKAIEFIRCLSREAVIPKAYKVTNPKMHSGQQVKAILQNSANAYADPYFHEWPVNSPRPVGLAINANATKFIHANAFVEVFNGAFTNFNVLTRQSCHSFVRIKLESGVDTKLGFTVTTKEGSSEHVVQATPFNNTCIGWLVLPLPQENDNVRFTNGTCPGINRIEVELFSEEMYFSNASTVDPTGKLITFQTGLAWPDTFNAIPGGGSDCHLLENTIATQLSKKVGYTDFKAILEVYFLSFCNRRNWPAFFSNDRTLYCSPDDWDRFIVKDVDRSLAARTLINIAYTDIYSSMALVMTSDSYLAAFTARM